MNEETVKEEMSNQEEIEEQAQEENQQVKEEENQPEKQKETEQGQSETTEEAEGEEQPENSDDEHDENEHSLESEIKKLEHELEELKARYLRVQADFDNFRKRTKAEKEAAAKYRSQSLAEQLLPVLDNFERALAVETTNEESKSILTGVDMVYRQFTEALKAEGIEEIEALGQPFDPHKHQAVMQEKSDGHEPGIVIEVLQKGYRIKDRVIRPSMVKVSE